MNGTHFIAHVKQILGSISIIPIKLIVTVAIYIE